MNKRENSEYKIQIRGGFADRNNIHPINTTMQYTDLDNRSRVAIVNVLSALYHDIFNGIYNGINDYEKKEAFWRRIIFDVYSKQIDFSSSLVDREESMFEIIDSSIYEEDYANVLSLVEFIARLLHKEATERYKQFNVYSLLNQVFEGEYIGYRFVNGTITKITNDIEIKAIEEAVNVKTNKVDEHVDKALRLLSDRDNPDYENSIKESISAVEAICNEILGKKATLGDALKQLKKQIDIHPSMESAFEKLYGYTSDASGIRHAGQMGGPNASFEEAKFMLVACSGFINYLKGIISKEDIKA